MNRALAAEIEESLRIEERTEQALKPLDAHQRRTERRFDAASVAPEDREALRALQRHNAELTRRMHGFGVGRDLDPEADLNVSGDAALGRIALACHLERAYASSDLEFEHAHPDAVAAPEITDALLAAPFSLLGDAQRQLLYASDLPWQRLEESLVRLELDVTAAGRTAVSFSALRSAVGGALGMERREPAALELLRHPGTARLANIVDVWRLDDAGRFFVALVVAPRGRVRVRDAAEDPDDGGVSGPVAIDDVAALARAVEALRLNEEARRGDGDARMRALCDRALAAHRALLRLPVTLQGVIPFTCACDFRPPHTHTSEPESAHDPDHDHAGAD